MQSARLVRQSCWASAAGPDFYGGLAPWTADGLLDEPGGRRMVEYVSCEKKMKRATTK